MPREARQGETTTTSPTPEPRPPTRAISAGPDTMTASSNNSLARPIKRATPPARRPQPRPWHPVSARRSGFRTPGIGDRQARVTAPRTARGKLFDGQRARCRSTGNARILLNTCHDRAWLKPSHDAPVGARPILPRWKRDPGHPHDSPNRLLKRHGRARIRTTTGPPSLTIQLRSRHLSESMNFRSLFPRPRGRRIAMSPCNEPGISVTYGGIRLLVPRPVA
jgi:hypothetical protein